MLNAFRAPQTSSYNKWDRCAAWQAHIDPSGGTSILDLRIYGPQDVNTYLPLLKKSPSAIIAPSCCWDDDTVGSIICSDSRLRSIALCGVWNAKMPQVIASFAYITYLDMSNMKIRGGDLKAMIPAFSSLAKTLRYLDMSYNPIQDVGVDDLADILSPLVDLVYLDVGHCQLSPKPQTKQPTNQPLPDLTKLSKTLSALTQLTHLNLGGNYMLRDVGSKKMGAALHSLTQLTHLDVSWNELDDANCEALIQAMGTLPCLHTLILNGNKNITVEGWRTLAPLLTVPTLLHLELRQVGSMHLEDVNHLTYLDFQDYVEKKDFSGFLGAQTSLKTLKMGQRHVTYFKSIGSFLKQQSQLTRFELQHGADAMADVVSALNMTTLTHLELEGCMLGDVHMRTLAANGPQLTQLQFLSLYDNCVSDSNVSDLAKLLSYTPLLTHLNLGNCDLTHNVGAELAQCLAPLTQLRFLSLEGLVLVDVVHQAISGLTLLEDLNVAYTCSTGKDVGPMLQHLTNLMRLDLKQGSRSHSYITAKCAKLIAPSLSLLTRLTFLDFGLCKLEDKGLASLAVALAQMSHLRELNLYGCHLTEKSAKLLAKCMANWKLLEQLYLGDNKFKSNSIKLMMDSFGHLQSLHTLSLNTTHLDAKADKWLAKMLPLAPCLTWVDLVNNKDLLSAGLVDLKAVWDADYDFESFGIIRRKTPFVLPQ